jgi:hypothetical protein
MEFMPSPPWGRGWLATGVLISRGESGEGVYPSLYYAALSSLNLEARRMATELPYRRPKDRILPHRTREVKMTIGIGFKCVDGIVLCSDTEMSCPFGKPA